MKINDANNSMNNSIEDSEEKNKKSKKNKRQKKDKKETKIKNKNILDDIKKEEIDQKKKILEEVNNTMIEENKKPKHNKTKKEEESTSFNVNKMNESNTDKEKEKEKEKEKGNKKKKKVNNIINDTFNELEKEINEEYNLKRENIYEINNKFDYPKDSPVFYIRDDNSNTDLYDYPLSTKEIIDKLSSKEIKPYLIKVKLIDIFTMNNYDPFSYFDFNDVLKKNWSKNLEYSSIFLTECEKNKKLILEEQNKNLEITLNENTFSIYPKYSRYNNMKNKISEREEKDNNITLNLNFSAIDKKGLNDFSMSIIKQLENVPLTKKKMEKIQTIIEEVEEDEWTEIKSKKKEEEKKTFVGIVGLNESRQIIPPEESNKNNYKKKKKGKNNKKKFVNSNNQFAGLKVEYGSDDEEDEK